MKSNARHAFTPKLVEPLSGLSELLSPSVKGTPEFCMPYPSEQRFIWISRLQASIEDLGQDLERVRQSELVKTPLGKQRLQLLERGLTDQKTQLSRVAEKMGMVSVTTPVSSVLAGAMKANFQPLAYWENFFRDWVWGEEERRSQDELVQATLGRLVPEGAVLIAGAGYGRMAYDWSRAFNAQVFALEHNPVMGWMVDRLVVGDLKEIWEIPYVPKSLADVAVRHAIAPMSSVRERPRWIVGDFFCPPFLKESFDWIVTPWFVDVVTMPFEKTASQIRALLKPGGYWLNFGPASFCHRSREDRLTTEELVVWVEKNGFRQISSQSGKIPYLQSPHSNQQRWEFITTSLFQRGEGTAKDDVLRETPTIAWVQDRKKTIPYPPSLESVRAGNQLMAELLGRLRDGISLGQLLPEFASKYGMSPQEMEGPLLDLILSLEVG